MRRDLSIIADLINPNASVLDLGCGNGELLAYLRAEKQVRGYGLEIEADNISTCISQGVNVIEQDLDKGLSNFASNSFEMVVMTETLQAVQAPDRMIDEMLRIGEQCIVTFPNFGYWRCRLQLVTDGRMPVASHIPHSWYNTPNIHLCTFKDFERLCLAKSLNIMDRFVVSADYLSKPLANTMPNFFGAIAFYRLSK